MAVIPRLINELSHDRRQSLAHNLSTTAYKEFNRDYLGRVESVVAWDSPAKGRKIREVIITRDLTDAVSVITKKAYDDQGQLFETLAVSLTRLPNLRVGSVSLEHFTSTFNAQITSPTAGANLPMAAFDFTLTISDTRTVTSVELHVDGELVATLNAAPYTTSVDGAELADGPHAFMARITDAGGFTQELTITAMKPTQAVVSITSPISGTVVADAAQFLVSIVNGTLSRVEYYDGPTKIGESTSSPFSFAVDTTAWTAGQHSITATAYLTNGFVVTSAPVVLTKEEVVEPTAPVISNILSTPSENGSIIEWDVLPGSTGQVFYGASSSLGLSSTKEFGYLDYHRQELRDLAPGTTYYFEIECTSQDGLTTRSGQQSFKTTGTQPGPAISTIVITPGLTSVVIEWDLNPIGTGQIFYGTSASLGSASTRENGYLDYHRQEIRNLSADTTYYFQIESVDEAGRVSRSAIQTFATSQIDDPPEPATAYPPDVIGITGYPQPYADIPALLGTPLINLGTSWGLTSPEGDTITTRVSDYPHHYSRDSPWNCDETLALVNGGRILDGKTYAPLRTVTLPSEHKMWSNTDPRYIYGASSSSRAWRRIDATTGTSTTLHTYTASELGFASLDSISLGDYESAFDNEDRYAAILARLVSGGNYTRIFIIDVKTGDIVRTLLTSYWRVYDACISQNGQYLVASVRDTSVNDQTYNDVYDIATGTRLRRVANGSHWDAGVATNGRQVIVSGQFNVSTNPTYSMVYMDSGERVKILEDHPGRTNDWLPFHVSCRNIKRPGWAYYSQTYSGSGLTKVRAANSFHRIVAVKLDGSGTIENFAWDHSAEPSGSTSGNIYDREIMVSASPTGTRVWWKCAWNVTDAPPYSYVSQKRVVASSTPSTGTGTSYSASRVSVTGGGAMPSLSGAPIAPDCSGMTAAQTVTTLQTALDNARTAGKPLVVPGGRQYTINSPLTVRTSVIWDGQGTMPRFKNNSASDSWQTGALFIVRSMTGWIYGLNLVGNRDTGNHEWAANICLGAGVNGLTIKGNKIENAGGDSIWDGATGYGGGSAENVLIDGNSLLTPGRCCIAITNLSDRWAIFNNYMTWDQGAITNPIDIEVEDVAGGRVTNIEIGYNKIDSNDPATGHEWYSSICSVTAWFDQSPGGAIYAHHNYGTWSRPFWSLVGYHGGDPALVWSPLPIEYSNVEGNSVPA